MGAGSKKAFFIGGSGGSCCKKWQFHNTTVVLANILVFMELAAVDGTC